MVASFDLAFRKAMNRFTGGLYGWLFDESNEQDVRMTADRALSYAPVWNCVSTISGAFMIMPLNTLKQTGKNIEEQPKHSSYQLLRWRPNTYQTPSQFKRQMLCHALLWGNARAYVVRDGRTPTELIPLLPDRTVSFLAEGNKYHATLVDRDDRLSLWVDMTTHTEKLIYIPDPDVWHVPGLGFDGIEGKSVISLARQSWGIGLGAETHTASQQKKGYAGGLMLEAPVGAFRDEGKAKEFLSNFKEKHGGPKNAGEIGLLREGIKAHVLAMNNSDAQFIEQRRFQREDAALWFLLQGILGDTSGNSYSSLEQKNLAYRINCLAPWTTAIEEECDLKLLTQRERDAGFYHKFNDGALLRTEKAATASFVSQLITARVINPNEAREMFDWNPYEGGDEYANPAVTSGAAGKPGSTPLDAKPAEKQQTAADLAANQSRIAHLLGVESSKVVDAAIQASEKDKNFVAWLDDFYDTKWLAKLSSVYEEIGIGTDAAVDHCGQSKEEILLVCGWSTPENLVENVRNCVISWKARAQSIGKANV